VHTKAFWHATAERAVKTLAQTAAALIGAGVVNIVDVDWQQVVGVSATAALLSVLTSVASANVGGDGPSLGPETLTEEQ